MVFQLSDGEIRDGESVIFGEDNINTFYLFFKMGCKFSISIVHPTNKSPTSKTLKIPQSPIFEKKNIEKEIESDSDSYDTLYIDTPPDSEKKRV